MFSLVPRCQGECASQKYTGMAVAALIRVCWAISLPWSQVSDRRRCAGRWPIAVVTASATASAVCAPGRWSRMVCRVVRSTRGSG